MKKIIEIILLSIIILISIFSTRVLIITIDNQNNKTDNNETIEEVSKEVDIEESITSISKQTTKEVEEIEEKYKGNVIGQLKIPKIELEAQISEGTDLDTLNTYIGHFNNSSLWEGNVALAAHNRNESGAHHFEGIHLLEDGDEIIYITNMGERRYEVFKKYEISDTDWSVTHETDENILTMITCITGKPDKRLCVQSKEI